MKGTELLQADRAYPTLRAYLNAQKKRGIQQSALAQELDITVSYLSDLKKGRTSPSLNLALRISDVTGVPLEALLKKRGG